MGKQQRRSPPWPPAQSAGAHGWALTSPRLILLFRQLCGQLRSEVCSQLRKTNAANCAARLVQLKPSGSAASCALPAGFFFEASLKPVEQCALLRAVLAE